MTPLHARPDAHLYRLHFPELFTTPDQRVTRYLQAEHDRAAAQELARAVFHRGEEAAERHADADARIARLRAELEAALTAAETAYQSTLRALRATADQTAASGKAAA